MTKNPILNALAALAYIILVASVMFGLSHSHRPDSLIIPITVISLFTLSATIMGYIFLSQPLQLYLDNKKKEAAALFGQTVAIFAGFTVIVLAIFALV